MKIPGNARILSLYGVAVLLLISTSFAQTYDPIEDFFCTGNGISDCTGSMDAPPHTYSRMDLEINGMCLKGGAPIASQYVFANNCTLSYQLYIFGYTENDQVLNDCGGLDTIGEVDAEATVGGVTTYSGEDCDGIPFESAPGAFVEAPC